MQWLTCLTPNCGMPVMLESLIASLSKKCYTHSLVLVGSRNGLERDITINLRYILNLHAKLRRVGMCQKRSHIK